MNNNFPYHIKHEYGETLIPVEPLRVITISTGQTDACTTLGVVPVGATRGHGTGVFEPYLPLSFPFSARELGKVHDIGERKDPDINAIKELQPDIILLNAAGLKDHGTLTSLQAIAPVVVTKGQGVNWRVDFLKVSEALGRQVEAKRWLQSFDHDCQHTHTVSETVTFIQSNGLRIKLMGHNSFSGLIARDMGANFNSGKRFHAVSRLLESGDLVDIDPHWIIYGGQGNGSGLIRSLPEWNNLRAVKLGQAIEVDYQPFFNNAGPTAARIVLQQLKAIIGLPKMAKN